MFSVYIVDDHPFVREGLKPTWAWIRRSASPGRPRWGNRPAGTEKLEPRSHHRPSPPADERRGAYQSHEESGLHTQVIILSSFCEDEEIIAAIDAGALSYLLKDSAPEKLLAAVKAARRGEPVLHPGSSKN